MQFPGSALERVKVTLISPCSFPNGRPGCARNHWWGQGWGGRCQLGAVPSSPESREPGSRTRKRSLDASSEAMAPGGPRGSAGPPACVPLPGMASLRSLISVLWASVTNTAWVCMTPIKCHLPWGSVRLHCSHRWHLLHTRAEMPKTMGQTTLRQATSITEMPDLL